MERKGINIVRLIGICWFLGMGNSPYAQELVSNGNFNYSDTCSFQSLSAPQEPVAWFTTFSSPDYYHSCFPADFSVPFSSGGGGGQLQGKGIWDCTYTGVIL